jgi:hypothetical protein
MRIACLADGMKQTQRLILFAAQDIPCRGKGMEQGQNDMRLQQNGMSSRKKGMPFR